MNADRTERRYRILIDIFYQAKSRHLALDNPIRAGQWDERTLRDLMKREEATFPEVKAALTWVFVTDRTRYWANNLTDIPGFCKAYPTICDQLDAHLPAPPTLAGRTADGADHIRAQAERPTLTVVETEPSEWVNPAESSVGDFMERLERMAAEVRSRRRSSPTDRKDLQ